MRLLAPSLIVFQFPDLTHHGTPFLQVSFSNEEVLKFSELLLPFSQAFQIFQVIDDLLKQVELNLFDHHSGAGPLG